MMNRRLNVLILCSLPMLAVLLALPASAGLSDDPDPAVNVTDDPDPVPNWMHSEPVGVVTFIFNKGPVPDPTDPNAVISTRFTIPAINGEVPSLARIAALEGVTRVTIEGVAAPLGTCSDVHDCQEAVAASCVNAGLGGGNAEVTIEFNSGTGRGSCSGTCTGGGEVVVSCAKS